MVHLLSPFEVATLPSRVVGEWERDPFGYSSSRVLGMFASDRRAWRAEEGRASVQLTSIHHPRPVSLDLDDLLFSQVRTVVWSQRLDVLDKSRGEQGVPGATAERLRMRVRVEGSALPFGVPVGGRELDVIALTWTRGHVNTYAYVGAAGGDHRDEVLARFPGSIRYEAT